LAPLRCQFTQQVSGQRFGGVAELRPLLRQSAHGVHPPRRLGLLKLILLGVYLLEPGVESAKISLRLLLQTRQSFGGVLATLLLCRARPLQTRFSHLRRLHQK
jgi:hypothetical protein